nr:MAG: type III pantothenate kinase [Pseudomonadota bacterium]
MILLLDVGNTRIKWATVDDAGIMTLGRSLQHAGRDIPSVAEEAWHSLPRPERVIVSNVAGRGFEGAFRVWAQSVWGMEPRFIVAQSKGWGVTNAYVEPDRLGADRWAALVAARRLDKGDVCIIDCGTALTIDALSRSGKHLGGLIVPGLALMRQSLIANTQGISDEGEGTIALLARCTRDAVTGGTLYATVAVIDRVITDIVAELGRTVTCVITGGDAERIMPLLTVKCRYEPDLVLQGLKIMAEGKV